MVTGKTWLISDQSLLTSVFKVFKKIVYESLLQHINVNNILVEEQFGFRPATSTDRASYEILNVTNERKVVGGIFCELQKALIVLTITSY
jgi:hypothetical protein